MAALADEHVIPRQTDVVMVHSADFPFWIEFSGASQFLDDIHLGRISSSQYSRRIEPDRFVLRTFADGENQFLHNSFS
jgi:hypothetical protein